MLVRHEKQIVNLNAVADAHWEGPKLFIHYIGGRFQSMSGPQAHLFWNAIQQHAENLPPANDQGPAPAGEKS